MGIKIIQELPKQKEVERLLEDSVNEWFYETFPGGFTPPQLAAIPSIHSHNNTLIFAPTGSGKTLSAFLSLIDELFKLGREGQLEDTVYALYISPLRALSNDIRRNLEEPLSGILRKTREKGIDVPEIRQAVRTGDTTQSERQKIARKPPHILITTPESFLLLLCSPKFKEKLRSIKWVLVDEIHEISDNKRGSLLSLGLEMLTRLVGKEFTRIGLSATQSPLERIAQFLVGYKLDGTSRDCRIANLSSERTMDLRLLSPVTDIVHTSFANIEHNTYLLFTDLVEEHETTLIFTNTRAASERHSFRLKQILGKQYLGQVAAHHGSLSREHRFEIEERLKRGELKAVVCSSSLELGIDIGNIDLVVQSGSPKSVSRFIQRAGRAGHSLDKITKARLVAENRDDLLECAVLLRSAKNGEIDRISIPEKTLDVLAQTLVGISLDGAQKLADVYKMVKQSYTYAKLTYEEFVEIIEYLSGQNLIGSERAYAQKIWYDSENKTFGRRRTSRLLYYTNMGVIADYSSYQVVQEGYRSIIGSLSSEFVEMLVPGDVFILTGRAYQFIRIAGYRAIVRGVIGRRANVPSWVGQLLPRSFDLSLQIGKFIREITTDLKHGKLSTDKLIQQIQTDYFLDLDSATSIIEYMNEQVSYLDLIPSDKQILIETYIDRTEKYTLIFHAYFGRRVNEALSRAYAYQIANEIGWSVSTAVNDNGFLITLPANTYIDLENISSMVSKDNMKDLLIKAIHRTELFKQRFKQCATRGLMILRNINGRQVSPHRQQRNTQKLLSLLANNTDFCLVRETIREIIEDYMDIENAIYVLDALEKGKMEITIAPVSETPSPLAHNLVLLNNHDVIMLEDKQALLREFHQKVLSQVLGEEAEKDGSLFSLKAVNEVFSYRQLQGFQIHEGGKKDILNLHSKLQPIAPFTMDQPALLNFVPQSAYKSTIKNAIELLNEKKIVLLRLQDLKEYSVLLKDVATFLVALHRSIAYNTDKLDDYILSSLKEREKATTDEVFHQITQINENGVVDGKKVTSQIIDQRLKSLHQGALIFPISFEYLQDSEQIIHKWQLSSQFLSEETQNLISKLDPEYALEQIIIDYLRKMGPSNVHNLLQDLPLQKDQAESAIQRLEQIGKILSGNLVPDKVSPQYIRTEDRDLIRDIMRRSEGKQEYFTSAVLQEFKLRSTDLIPETNVETTKDRSEKEIISKIEEILLKHIFVPTPSSLLIRVPGSSFTHFQELRKEKKIIRGRFLRGRLGYIHARDLATILSIIRDNEIEATEVQMEILAYLKNKRTASKRELSDVLEIDAGDLSLQIEGLEKNGFLTRSIDQADRPHVSRSAIIYESITHLLESDHLPDRQHSIKQVIQRIINGTGIMTLFECMAKTGLSFSDLELVVNQLVDEKEIDSAKLSLTPTEYYMSSGAIDKLREIKQQHIEDDDQLKREQVHILAPLDPYLVGEQHSVHSATAGALSTYLILRDNLVIGSFRYSLRYSKTAQIIGLHLGRDVTQNTHLMIKIAVRLKKFMQKNYLIPTILVEDAADKSLLAPSNEILVNAFQSAKYRLVRGVLIGGETVGRLYERQVILQFCKNNHFFSFRKEITDDVLLDHVNLRGEVELVDLLQYFQGYPAELLITQLNILLRSGKLRATFSQLRSINYSKVLFSGLGKSRRKSQLSEEIIRLVDERQYLTLSEIASELKKTNTQIYASTRRLLNSGRLTIIKLGQDSKYAEVSIGCRSSEKISLEDAQKEFVITSLQRTGPLPEQVLISQLYKYGGPSKVRIRATLMKLIEEELVVHGFFVAGDPRIYYMTNTQREFLDNTPYDRLVKEERKNRVLLVEKGSRFAEIYVPLLQGLQTVRINKATSHLILEGIRIIATLDSLSDVKKKLEISNIQLFSDTSSEEIHKVIDTLEAKAKELKKQQISIKSINYQPLDLHQFIPEKKESESMHVIDHV